MTDEANLTLPQQRALRILRRSYGWMSARTLHEKGRTLEVLFERGYLDCQAEDWNMPGKLPEWEYRLKGGTLST